MCKFARTRPAWAVYLLFACSPFLQGCIPFYFQATKTLELQEPSAPLTPASLIAPKAVEAISIVRPIRSDWGPEIYRGIHRRAGAIAGPPISGVPIMFFEDRFFVPSVDPSVWVADGLTAGLENAGYRVEGPGSLERAHTPVAITVDVNRLSAKDTNQPPPRGCAAMVAARIKVVKQGQLLLDRTYEGKDGQPGLCVYPITLSLVTRKALEDMLDHAVPELTALLARAAKREPAATSRRQASDRDS